MEGVLEMQSTTNLAAYCRGLATEGTGERQWNVTKTQKEKRKLMSPTIRHE